MGHDWAEVRDQQKKLKYADISFYLGNNLRLVLT